MLFQGHAPTDADLVRAVLQGHVQRFAVLVERYQSLVYHITLSRISHPQDAEDLTQETFLKAYRRLEELEDPAKFGPWVRRIAENLAWNALRSRRLAATAAPEAWTVDAPDPARLFETQEQRDRVWAAIEELPVEQRETVLLFYMEGYSQERVATFLEISVSAVKLRLLRARATLRDDLAVEADRQVAEAVRARSQRSGGVRRLMSVLPLVPWYVPVGRTMLGIGRLGWGVAVGAALGLGTLGAALGVGLWQGWWGPKQQQPLPATQSTIATPEPERRNANGTASGHGTRVFLAPAARNNGSLGESLFGGEALTPLARGQEAEALRRGKGGNLTWEFDGSDPQGWRVRERLADAWPPEARTAEVHDGVLRIPLGTYQPDRLPAIELISPEIGYDARLFDRIEVRLRVVPPLLARGGLGLTWTTSANRLFPGQDPKGWRRLTAAERQAEWERGLRGQREPRTRPVTSGSWQYGPFWAADTAFMPFGPGWQTLVAKGLRESPVTGWQDDLVDVRLMLWLADLQAPEATNPVGGPLFLEIDSITLRDARRLALSLEPPIATPTQATGSWLGDGRLYPLTQPGLQWPILGDLDGDGDLDLVVSYRLIVARNGSQQGWVVAFNDGHGGFSAGLGQVLTDGPPGDWPMRITGADLNGDRLIDLVVGLGPHTRLFLNQGRGIFAPDRVWANQRFVGRGDVDGDGLTDLALGSASEIAADTAGTSPASLGSLFRNYGQAVFAEQDLGASIGPEWYPHALDDFDGDGLAELACLSGSIDANSPRRLLLCDDFTHGTWQRQFEIPYPTRPDERAYYLQTLPAYLGDVDRDGVWELGVPMAAYAESQVYGLGLQLHRSLPDTRSAILLPTTVHLRTSSMSQQPTFIPQICDLNRDGLFDPLVLDLNYRQGFSLHVLRGQHGRLPVEEGRYPLPAEPYGWAVGDVNGDGADDVVVVVEGAEGAGVYVLLNRVGTLESAKVASNDESKADTAGE